MEDIHLGVPQGSVLGSIFHVVMHNLFSISSNIKFAIYTDDNTPYIIGRNSIEDIERIELASNSSIKRFPNNKDESQSWKVSYHKNSILRVLPRLECSAFISFYVCKYMYVCKYTYVNTQNESVPFDYLKYMNCFIDGTPNCY